MNAAIVRAARTLETRIALLGRRIQQLDAHKESVTAANPGTDMPDSPTSLQNTMENLVRLHSERMGLRAQYEVVWAFGKVLEDTPARSGYARSGWTLTTGGSPTVPPRIPAEQQDEYHADRVEAAVREALSRLPDDPLVPVYVGNAVPYMALLEAGLSDQAPAGFVAAAVENLRARLNLLAHEDSP